MSALNVIRCDLSQTDYLVWKWRPEQGSLARQNQVRFGSSLRVRAGEIACLFYSNAGGGSPVDYIEGPADLKLETRNLPILADIIGLAYGGDSPFQAEVYFINKGQAPQLKWGVPYFDAFDPRFPDLPVPVAVNGTITFSITDVKRFVEVQRLENFISEKLREQILPQLRAVIKSNMVNLATARGIPLVQIGSRVEDLTAILAPTAAKVLEGYGVTLRNFVVEGVEIKKGCEDFKKLMQITRDQSVLNITTQGDLGRTSMGDAHKLNVEHLAGSQKIEREQSEKWQRLKTESDFLATHQVNLQADVARTAAENLGKMSHSKGGDGGIGKGEIHVHPSNSGHNNSASNGNGSARVSSGIPGAFEQQIVSGVRKTAEPVLGKTTGTCPRCNTSFQAGAKFCCSCGTAVTSSSASNVHRIHIAREKQQLGIFTLEEINHRASQGEFVGSDLGWYPSLSEWRPLSTIPGVNMPAQTPPPL